MSKWITRWRLNRTTLLPETVTVLTVSHDYVLVQGEDHTSYVGGFFATPEEAFAHEIGDAERSIKYGMERKARVLTAQERFNKGGRDG